jgi:hypothetical protein
VANFEHELDKSEVVTLGKLAMPIQITLAWAISETEIAVVILMTASKPSGQ